MKIQNLLSLIFLLAIIFFIHPKANIHAKRSPNFEDHANLDNITDTIRKYVGVHESHQIHTEDGYILEIFRIPRPNPKGAILLQHPIFFDARIWVSQYNESVAFLFWRAGYDVWLGNTRGNYFCKRHTSLTTKDPEFWDFSFHEMGYYDNHAIVAYIRKTIGWRKIFYLGYSMGASSGLVYASTRSDDVADGIELMITLAPVTHLHRGTSIAKYIVPPFYWLQRTFNFVDLRDTVLGHDVWYLKLSRSVFRHSCLQKILIYVICSIAGWTPDEIDPNLIDMMLTTFGSEVPLKLGNHYNQIYVSGGVFKKYDHGEAANLKLYGDRNAPLYPLEDIKVPVYIVYGQGDSFSCIEDIDVLYKELPESSKIYGRLMAEGLNHADFTLGRHRNERVYQKILELLEKTAYNKERNLEFDCL